VTVLAALSGPAPWLVLAGVTVVFLLVDFRFFAPDREPTLRECAVWSVGWLVLSLLAAFPLWLADSGHAALTYTTVYFVTRSLSVDNLFVFIILFAYFGVPHRARAKLLLWGIVGAIVLRGLAILGGLALIRELHFVVYILGALLLVLAWRILSGVEENVHPDRNPLVRIVRKVFPVAGEDYGDRWFLRRGGVLYATPLFLCLAAFVAADIAFAIDSIPAAFAITSDSFLIWMGNVFALLGLRALFGLVTELIRRFRFLDETIAIVLGLVGLKLIVDRWVHISTGVSLAVVAGAFALGILASLAADRLDSRRGPGSPC
jgi:tellurite resistance protein TerC